MTGNAVNIPEELAEAAQASRAAADYKRAEHASMQVAIATYVLQNKFSTAVRVTVRIPDWSFDPDDTSTYVELVAVHDYTGILWQGDSGRVAGMGFGTTAAIDWKPLANQVEDALTEAFAYGLSAAPSEELRQQLNDDDLWEVDLGTIEMRQSRPTR